MITFRLVEVIAVAVGFALALFINLAVLPGDYMVSSLYAIPLLVAASRWPWWLVAPTGVASVILYLSSAILLQRPASVWLVGVLALILISGLAAYLAHQRVVVQERTAQLAAALRLRDEFISTAAHELKTPVTILSGAAQLLLRRLVQESTIDSAWLRRTAQSIHDQARKQARLIDQVLDLTRFDEGQLLLDQDPTDISALVRRVVADQQTTSDHHELVVHAPDGLMASVDGIRLEQVLVNLLSNAIKFSPDGGPITVHLTHPVPDALRLSITDQGIGIPEKQRPWLFTRFFQGHSADHRSGLGLGLYLSKQWVELHGGQIHAEFPDEGGSRFVMTIPIGKPVETATTVARQTAE
jgi:signal transduction histidine kinase